MKVFVFGILSILFFASQNASATIDPSCAVKALLAVTQTNDMILGRVAATKPVSVEYVKVPQFAFKITSGNIADYPPVIRKYLGAVDATAYNSDELTKNIGSFITIQFAEANPGKNLPARPDIYVTGKNALPQYAMLSVADVFTKNPELGANLQNFEDVRDLLVSGDPRVVGAIKTAVVPLIKMSDIGYPVSAEVVIESPWGTTQKKDAGVDAYLAFDQGKGQYYMINSRANGLPLGYVPAQGPQ